MFKFLTKIISFFTPYVHPLEKRADRFLEKVSDKTDKSFIHKKILELMRENIVVFHLWCERRYKGYRYLTKKKRKALYGNLSKMRESFGAFCHNKKIDTHKVLQHIQNKGVKFHGNIDALKYLTCMMAYFSGPGGHFKYEESSNFGKLLKDPAKSKLIGDCNQIVTLYVYFFGIQYDIEGLRIKVYPGHVCLHYGGVDIEATSGTFQNYHKKDQKILPITELIAVNLLDIQDVHEKLFPISLKALMESAKLTFLLSSNRTIASHNLKAAYQSIVAKAMKENQYSKALEYAKQSEDEDLIENVSHNAAIYHLNHKQFRKAENYSNLTKNEKLHRTILEAEGIHYFNQKNYSKALSLFQKIHHEDHIKSCYSSMCIELNKELASVKTRDQLKRKKYTLQKMEQYAKKSHNPKLIKHVSDLLEQI